MISLLFSIVWHVVLCASAEGWCGWWDGAPVCIRWDGVSCYHRIPLASAPTNRPLSTSIGHSYSVQPILGHSIRDPCQWDPVSFACKDLHDQSLQAQAGVPSVLIVCRMKAAVWKLHRTAWLHDFMTYSKSMGRLGCRWGWAIGFSAVGALRYWGHCICCTQLLWCRMVYTKTEMIRNSTLISLHCDSYAYLVSSNMCSGKTTKRK